MIHGRSFVAPIDSFGQRLLLLPDLPELDRKRTKQFNYTHKDVAAITLTKESREA